MTGQNNFTRNSSKGFFSFSMKSRKRSPPKRTTDNPLVSPIDSTIIPITYAFATYSSPPYGSQNSLDFVPTIAFMLLEVVWYDTTR